MLFVDIIILFIILFFLNIKFILIYFLFLIKYFYLFLFLITFALDNITNMLLFFDFFDIFLIILLLNNFKLFIADSILSFKKNFYIKFFSNKKI